MTLYEAYKDAVKRLDNPDKDEISVRILLCHNNGIKSMSGFYIHKNENLRDFPGFLKNFEEFLAGKPIQYILRESEFLGLNFYVDERVLIPRQETEQLVLETEKLIKNELLNLQLNIADVCCGSGAIGLSLSKLLPESHFYLSDISKEAIGVSKTNAKNLNLEPKIEFLEGDMLKPFIKKGIKLDVIVCNPPYIKDITTIDERTLKQEPHLALLADPDTMFYESLLMDVHKVLNDKYIIAFEIGEDMKESLEILVKKYCPNDEFYFQEDMYGKTRFLFIKHQ